MVGCDGEIGINFGSVLIRFGIVIRVIFLWIGKLYLYV